MSDHERPNNRLPAQERYHRDPTFKVLVDTLDGLIEAAQLTPTEVREAAVLACIHNERRKPLRFYYNKESELCTPDTEPR